MVLFYHLTQRRPEEVIASLAPRALSSGARVMLRGQDPKYLDWLDDWLWKQPRDGFLPHGRAGGEFDRDQPLLLGEGAAVNGAKVIFLLGGMGIDPEEARALDKVCLLFEDQNEAHMQAARAEWRAVTAAGLTAQYWSDASGQWEKKAESGGA